MHPDELNISVLNGVLTLKGDAKPHALEDKGQYLRQEIGYGTFERSFKMGRSVRAEQVKAQYRDGVLEVRVPKAEEARVRDIEVQAG